MHKPMIVVSLLAVTGFGWMQDRAEPIASLADAKMILEWTPGEGAVLLIDAESEEPLQRAQIFRSDGQELIEIDARHGGRSRLAGLEIELREARLEALVESYPEGSYDIRATTAQGQQVVGRAWLSLDVPPAPQIVHPAQGALVSTAGLTLSWLGDPTVAAYEVQLEQGEDDGLRVKLPPQQSSFRVPADFLRPGLETTFEVVAIGSNGNRTLAEVLFATMP